MEGEPFMTDSLPGMRLRAASADDAAQILSLYRGSREDLLALPLPADAMDTLIAQQLFSQQVGIQQNFPNARTWVVEFQHHLVARMIYDTATDRMRLIDIIVAPALQRRGLARQLIQLLQQKACDRNVPLELRVMKTNPGARRLYAKCGFATVAQDDLGEQMRWQRVSDPCL